MKKIFSFASLSLLALSAMIAVPAQAVDLPSSFTVKVDLVAKCLITTLAADLNFGTYTSFGSPTTVAPFTNVSVKCTNGLTAPTAVLDSASGVVQGLAFTLALAPAVKTAGIAGDATTAATEDAYSFKVTGSMATGQAGTGSGAGTSTARSLTISY